MILFILFILSKIKTGVGTVRYPRLEPRDAECAAKLKKRTLTNLYNERPAWLDLAHKRLDAAVTAAYGWTADLTDEQILEQLLALNGFKIGVLARRVPEIQDFYNSFPGLDSVINKVGLEPESPDI